jgi:hypothetical protein
VDSPFECFDRTAQPLLVPFGGAARRPVRLQLAKRQIAAKDPKASFRKRGRKSHQERRLAACAGTVRQDETLVGRICGGVKVSANWNHARRRVLKRLELRLTHRSPLLAEFAGAVLITAKAPLSATLCWWDP